MMPELLFVPLDEPGFSILTSWFADPELRRRFEFPTRVWFDYVRSEPNVYGWIVREDGDPVGLLQLDIHPERTGYIGFYVKPELRGQGYGRRILRALLARPEITGLRQIVATTEPDNLASQRCLLAVNFSQDGTAPDQDGFLRFVNSPAQTGG